MAHQQVNNHTTSTEVRNPTPTINIIRLPKLLQKVGMSRSAVYQLAKSGNFPSPIKLGGARASGWIESEVDKWLVEQIQKSRGGVQ
jgi:prophage regulatory protein